VPPGHLRDQRLDQPHSSSDTNSRAIVAILSHQVDDTRFASKRRVPAFRYALLAHQKRTNTASRGCVVAKGGAGLRITALSRSLLSVSWSR
jgi:hypothetical protein